MVGEILVLLVMLLFLLVVAEVVVPSALVLDHPPLVLVVLEQVIQLQALPHTMLVEVVVVYNQQTH
tara:strand:+ start:290 stop:487 length:198 start_codon:yes stop_codon:yes gene_type:complete